MKRLFGRVLLLGLVAALALTVLNFEGGQATVGTFCSPQGETHTEMWKDVPGNIFFASGPQRVVSASLSLWDGTEMVVLPASNFVRTPGTNHWTATVDFSVDRDDYWAYLIIKNNLGPCEFKYGTITVK